MRYGSRAPEAVCATETRRVFAPRCGTCGEALARVTATRRKALVDVQLHPHAVEVLIESERQWFGHCKREMAIRDPHSLPFTEYGLNTFLVVMILRFRSHASVMTSLSESLGVNLVLAVVGL